MRKEQKSKNWTSDTIRHAEKFVKSVFLTEFPGTGIKPLPGEFSLLFPAQNGRGYILENVRISYRYRFMEYIIRTSERKAQEDIRFFFFFS